MCITLPFVYLLYEARKASYSLAPYSFFKKSVSSKRRSGKSGRSIFTGPFALQITLNLVLPPPSGRRLFLNEKILATFFSPYGGTKEVPSLNIIKSLFPSDLNVSAQNSVAALRGAQTFIMLL